MSHEYINAIFINGLMYFTFFLTVYGKTGIHMVLRGHVKPIFFPYLLAGRNGVYPESFISLDESDLMEEDTTIVSGFDFQSHDSR